MYDSDLPRELTWCVNVTLAFKFLPSSTWTWTVCPVAPSPTSAQILVTPTLQDNNGHHLHMFSIMLHLRVHDVSLTTRKSMTGTRDAMRLGLQNLFSFLSFHKTLIMIILQINYEFSTSETCQWHATSQQKGSRRNASRALVCFFFSSLLLIINLSAAIQNIEDLVLSFLTTCNGGRWNYSKTRIYWGWNKISDEKKGSVTFLKISTLLIIFLDSYDAPLPLANARWGWFSISILQSGRPACHT